MGPKQLMNAPAQTKTKLPDLDYSMKHRFFLLVSLIAFALGTTASRAKDFDETHRFIFYAVLEGCYEDGLSTEDVAQILLKENRDSYIHFIYACPICTPTIHALEAYHSRPKQFYAMKKQGSTFGPGLGPEIRKQLYSTKPEDRLAAINKLMQGWISRRVELLRLSKEERVELQKKLEEMRNKGMDRLKNMEQNKLERYSMSAFANVHQCAVCNGACGLNLKPDAEK